MPLHWITSPEDVADAARRRDETITANRRRDRRDFRLTFVAFIIVVLMIALLDYVAGSGC